jgi:predicted nucleic acid-binding protein
MPSISNIKCLIDTNILVYAFDKKSPFHKVSAQILKECIESTRFGVIAQQNIVECANVIFRESKKERKEILSDLEVLINGFNLQIICPLETTLFTFFNLLRKLKRRKKEFFDVFLAATMLDNGVANILTANEKDFAGIKEITAYNPF